MSKNRDSTRKSARTLKHLEVHNQSPKAIVQNKESMTIRVVETVVIEVWDRCRVTEAWSWTQEVVVIVRQAVHRTTASCIDKRIVVCGLAN